MKQRCPVLEWEYGRVIGLFWLLSHKKIPLAYKAEEIEALAALNALSFAFELGFRSTILKGDSLGLTQAM